MKFDRIILKYKLFFPVVLFSGTVVFVAVGLFILERNTNKDILSFFDAIWWSVVTMSTTGYGDIVPKSFFGRIITLVAIIVGILATSLFTGTVASVYLNRISRLRSGFMNYSILKKHIVICGWRNDMKGFLLRTIEKEHLSISKIVVVAEAEQYLVDEVYETPALTNFKFVRGSFCDKNILLKANIIHADRAIVLADQTTVCTGFEIDSRTVMTVISIKSLNRFIHVTAQLLERNFEIYLQRVKCDEIIFSKAINTELLSLIVYQKGMSNVITALLGADTEESCHISIDPIHSRFINKSYGELETQIMEKNPNYLLLGILENTGKQHEIMDQAVRSAQKTADFPQMLEKLRLVKEIKPFRPVLIPQKNHILLAHSSVILLERKL